MFILFFLIFFFQRRILLLYFAGKTTVTHPEIQPVYVKSGDQLDLTCEQSEGFKVHWLKADRVTRQYKMIDSNNATGVLFLSRVIGKQVVQLIKESVTLSDEGSYKCAVQSGTDMPYAVEVYVLQGEFTDFISIKVFTN